MASAIVNLLAGEGVARVMSRSLSSGAVAPSAGDAGCGSCEGGCGAGGSVACCGAGAASGSGATSGPIEIG